MELRLAQCRGKRWNEGGRSLSTSRERLQWLHGKCQQAWHASTNVCRQQKRGKKWCHRIFFGLFGMAIVNAYIIYKETSAEIVPMLGTLGKSNTFPWTSKRRKIAYSVPAFVRFNNTGVHWPHVTEKKGRWCNIHLCYNTSNTSGVSLIRENHVYSTSENLVM